MSIMYSVVLTGSRDRLQVIGWTTDQKSVEIRNGAKAVIVALFNLNTPEFNRVLSQLSKLYQVSKSKTKTCVSGRMRLILRVSAFVGTT